MGRHIRYTGANRPRINANLKKQLEQGGAPKKSGRIKKKRVHYDGRWFDSPQECNRYKDLRLLEKAGQIKDLRCQVSIPLKIGERAIRMYSKRYHKTGRQVCYVADFVYFDGVQGCTVYEDSKGYRTEVYLLKRAIMRAMGYHILETD